MVIGNENFFAKQQKADMCIENNTLVLATYHCSPLVQLLYLVQSFLS